MKQKFDLKKPGSNWFFNIRKINTSYQDYDETFPHQHNFYQFLFFESGSGKHTIDGKEYEVKSKTIHFISPNHIHHLKLKPNAKGFVCMFKEELFFVHNESSKFIEDIELFSNWNENPIIDLLDEDFKELTALLLSINKDFLGEKMKKNEILLMGLKMFLMKASRINGGLGNVNLDKKKRIITRFLNMVDQNCNKNIPVSYYSKELNITSTYLNRVVNDVYDKSVSDFINERIILEAKRIIRLSSKSIKEISFELGFEDPSYFARFFKKHVALTPGQYRKKIATHIES